MKYEIEKNVPIPAPHKFQGATAILKSMEVGDSVWLRMPQSYASSKCGRLKPYRFKVRSEERGGVAGVRIWRIE